MSTPRGGSRASSAAGTRLFESVARPLQAFFRLEADQAARRLRVAGIGFTVALFIAGLAYPGSPRLLDEAKLGILAGSLASGVAGALLLRSTPPVRAAASEPEPPRSEAALAHQGGRTG